MADGSQQSGDFQGQDPSLGVAAVSQPYGYGAPPQAYAAYPGAGAPGGFPGHGGFPAAGPSYGGLPGADGSAFPAGAEALTFEQQQQQLQQQQYYQQWYQMYYQQQQQHQQQQMGAFAYQPQVYGQQMGGFGQGQGQAAKNKIFVGGLPYNLSEPELLAVFTKYNAVQANIIVDRETGQSRGFGFVAFADEATANEVQRTMNGVVIGGRSIRIGPATKRVM